MHYQGAPVCDFSLSCYVCISRVSSDEEMAALFLDDSDSDWDNLPQFDGPPHKIGKQIARFRNFNFSSIDKLVSFYLLVIYIKLLHTHLKYMNILHSKFTT